MSEYQYYEFQTADRRLSEKEMLELRAYSTRARITPTSFVNEYSFGNFKGNADTWREKYFDGFLYLANWGTHILQLALPAKLLSATTARLYCATEVASVREKSGRIILSFISEDENGGDWVEGEGLLSSLMPLRADLARGDLRCLYLGWLLGVQNGGLDDDEAEPAVPPNLAELSGALSHFIDFLRIDPELIAVAAQASPQARTPSANRQEMAAWVASLPTKEKDGLLVRLMDGGDMHIGAELLSRFNRQRAARDPAAEPPRRTVAELLAAAEGRREAGRREKARLAEEERAHRERMAAVAREKHLDSVATRVEQHWAEIESLIATKQPKKYDLAVQHLVDLRDVAARQGNESDFAGRLALLRTRHVAKPSFTDRLSRNRL
jgi:hypothetical protein